MISPRDLITDLETIENLCWNDFVGTSRSHRWLMDIEQNSKVTVSYNSHTKTFSPDDYSDITYFVKSLTGDIGEIEIKGRLNRVPQWQELIRLIVDLLDVDGQLYCQIDSPAYFSSQGTDNSDTQIINEAIEFIPLLNSWNIGQCNIRSFMDIQEPEFIAVLCQSTDIDFHGWKKIVSWIGVNNYLTELYELLDQNLFSSLDAKYVNTLWFSMRKNGDEENQFISEQKTTNQMVSKPTQINENYFSRQFLDTLNELMIHIPCATFWYRLSSFFRLKYGENINVLLDDSNKQTQQNWMKETINDEIAVDLVKTWHQLPQANEFLEYKGVSIGACIEYDLMKDVLAMIDSVTEAE